MREAAGERHTVLVIDDSPDTLTMLTDALEQSGANVLVAIAFWKAPPFGRKTQLQGTRRRPTWLVRVASPLMFYVPTRQMTQFWEVDKREILVDSQWRTTNEILFSSFLFFFFSSLLFSISFSLPLFDLSNTRRSKN